jgi:hypothetical protein
MNAELAETILHRLHVSQLALSGCLERPALAYERIKNVQKQLKLIAELVRQEMEPKPSPDDRLGAVRETEEQL